MIIIPITEGKLSLIEGKELEGYSLSQKLGHEMNSSVS